MKFIVDVKESKVTEFVTLLNSSHYVKIKPLTPYKAKVLEGISEAVSEMNLVLAGKLTARNADELLNEL